MKPRTWVRGDLHSVIVCRWSVKADGNHFDGKLLCFFNGGVFGAAVHNDDFKETLGVVQGQDGFEAFFDGVLAVVGCNDD